MRSQTSTKSASKSIRRLPPSTFGISDVKMLCSCKGQSQSCSIVIKSLAKRFRTSSDSQPNQDGRKSSHPKSVWQLWVPDSDSCRCRAHAENLQLGLTEARRRSAACSLSKGPRQLPQSLVIPSAKPCSLPRPVVVATGRASGCAGSAGSAVQVVAKLCLCRVPAPCLSCSSTKPFQLTSDAAEEVCAPISYRFVCFSCATPDAFSAPRRMASHCEAVVTGSALSSSCTIDGAVLRHTVPSSLPHPVTSGATRSYRR